MKKLLILLLFIFLSLNIYGVQDQLVETPGGNTGNLNFLNYPIGARALGMGGAFVAVADDPSAIYWNPSTLAAQSRSYLNVNFQLLPFDSLLGSIMFTTKPNMDGWAFGFGLLFETMYSVDLGINSGTDVNQYITNYGGTFTFSIAKKLGKVDNLFLGINAKFVTDAVDTNSGYGGGLDISFTVAKLVNIIDISVVLKDIITVVKYINTANAVFADPILRIGVSVAPTETMKIAIQIDKNLVTVDRVKFYIGGSFRIWQDNPFVIPDESKMKLDTKPKDNIKLSIGFYDGRFTAGLNLRFFGIRLNFAYLFRNEFYTDDSFLWDVVFHF